MIVDKDKNDMYKVEGLPKRKLPYFMLQKIPGKKDFPGKNPRK